VDEEETRALAGRGGQGLRIERPLSVDDAKRYGPLACAHKADTVEQPGVRRIGEHNLVSRIRQAKEGVQHRIAFAASDHDLSASIARPAAALDVCGYRLLEIVAASEGQPAVRFVLADRRPRRLYRLCR